MILFAWCLDTAFPKLDDHSIYQSDIDPPSCSDELFCSEEEVIDLLLSLDTSKANGSDGISATVMKWTAYGIAPRIMKLNQWHVERSQLSGKCHQLFLYIPMQRWWWSKCVQLSLLPIISKLLESQLITTHIEVYSPFSLYHIKRSFYNSCSSIITVCKNLCHLAASMLTISSTKSPLLQMTTPNCKHSSLHKLTLNFNKCKSFYLKI